MILYINTTLGAKLEIALYDKDGQKIAFLVNKVQRNESEKLLRVIDKLLGDKTLTWSDKLTRSESIKGIIVIKGPKGRFSAIRAGVICANALGFAWNVPVIGIESTGDIKGAIKKINKAKTFKKPVMPVYPPKKLFRRVYEKERAKFGIKTYVIKAVCG
jgi:hypothetical protein